MDILETFTYRNQTVTLRGDAADEHGERRVYIGEEDVSADCVQDAELPEWRERARMLIDAKLGPGPGTYCEAQRDTSRDVVRFGREAEGEEE